MTTIPLVDLKLQHREIAAEVELGFKRVIDSATFVLGEDVARFEQAFGEFCRVKHCIGVANGTDALELTLRALGIGTGDEVIVPANTFIATALAVARAGATVVIADVDETHQLIDPEEVARRITARTRAVLPVHLFGQIAPVEALEDVAARARLAIVEDAAQAHGATRLGRSIGQLGIAAGTSFYPGKNLGAYGDGGAVLTNDDTVAKKIRALRNYGSEVKYHHPETGFNSRLDTLQAVVLNAKLKRLSAWNAARSAAAKVYDALLADLPGVIRPSVLPGNEHVWHLYVIRVPERDDVVKAMAAVGIGVGIHYPVPIHMQGAFASLGHARGDFPVAERLAREILSLPLFPGITEAQQAEVVTALRAAVLKVA